MFDIVLPTALTSWAVLAGAMTLLWVLHLRRGEADVVDLGWSAGIGVQAVVFAWLGEGDPTRRALVGAIAGLWSARLSWHLLTDRVLEHGEDRRYAALRKAFGGRARLGFFGVFQANALLAVLLASGPLVVAQLDRPFGALDVAGGALFLVSFVGESVADRQLARFKRRPDTSGKTCREGLWRYSRHPNYFFEWLHWLSYPLLAASSVWALWTLVPVALIYVFLVHVTGIPPAERSSVESRGDDYRRYQQETNAFFPWFPRESDATMDPGDPGPEESTS